MLSYLYPMWDSNPVKMIHRSNLWFCCTPIVNKSRLHKVTTTLVIQFILSSKNWYNYVLPIELIGHLLCVEMDSNHQSTIFSVCPPTYGLEPWIACQRAYTIPPSTHILKIMLCFGLEPVPPDILAMLPITPPQHLSKNTHYISLSHLRPQFRPALTSLACQLVLASVSFLCIIKPNLFAEGERLELSHHFRGLTV